MEKLKEHKCFGGKVNFWQHYSVSTKTKMKFSTFMPPGEIKGALSWLSGLTCTDDNFITKASAQKYLAEKQMMVICPDTSPRGLDLPQEHESYDFGSGASFYLNATTPGYRDHYRMYDYVAFEIYEILNTKFAAKNRISIAGHSMGGHGALTIGLKEKDRFKSISAFSPIVNPSQIPWGQKAFKGYLGEDLNLWKAHDACELVKNGITHKNLIMIDQGLNDDFLNKQLFPENFQGVCGSAGQKLELRMLDGYDHSYYFISSFIQDHIEFHLGFLK